MNLKLKLSKYFLVISILSLITILVFIVQSGYSKIINQQTIKDSADNYSNEIIDATIDLSIIDKLKIRQEYGSENSTQ